MISRILPPNIRARKRLFDNRAYAVKTRLLHAILYPGAVITFVKKPATGTARFVVVHDLTFGKRFENLLAANRSVSRDTRHSRRTSPRKYVGKNKNRWAFINGGVRYRRYDSKYEKQNIERDRLLVSKSARYNDCEPTHSYRRTGYIRNAIIMAR